ncbi:MAG: hypothetical protein P0Y53_19650 [Candidatus Pseudobacter hemicellulosilyticus]|uniref:Endosialidase-like protein n=1 Tax=Candidatus Pseudobacter hemicellulosilyticus TaxID=3121375 RepID=A0AAJ5WQ58_9BACT|nr:MAG: hypothetical protein P0Y53_19650 [Pseudobacter sp.]
MKKYLVLPFLFYVSQSYAQTEWGTAGSRTEWRDSAGLQGNRGAKSGFYETSTPVGFPTDPDLSPVLPNWWHFLDIRHSNPENNHAMQFAGNFFTDNLYFRKTIDDPNRAWNRVLLERNGRVGIGTTQPREALQIGSRFFLASGGWKSIQYNMCWDDALGNNVRANDGPAAAMQFTEKGNINFFTAPSGTAGTNINDGANAMVIYQSGQVGVGTSYTPVALTDASFKFFVAGGVRAHKVKVDMQSWADHVFRPSYQLRPLSELALYIKEHGHLPDVPTAEEVRENGVDLGVMNRILLQKVEEVTLHLIQLNERVAQLEKENELLKTEKRK